MRGAPPRGVRLGLLGLGTVGSSVAAIVARHRQHIAQRTGLRLEVVRALVRHPRRRRSGAAATVPHTTRPDAVTRADDVDVVVELLGGHEPALGLVLDALGQGKPVVTANKAMLAASGPTLFAAAAAAGTDVYFEAAVAGGIPIVRALREGLASDRITEIRGILNGTTNFVLEGMERGADLATALAEAQRLGFAEADPSLDISGRDAADKLAILALLAFGVAVAPGNIATEGLAALTPEVLAEGRELGYRVKLLAKAKRSERSRARGLDLRVHPAFVPRGHALSTVPGAQNAIFVASEALGATLYQGPGAGGLPTGTAVVSDIIEAARNLRAGIHGRVDVRGGRERLRLLPATAAVSGYYVRLLVVDVPGVLASVARILAEHHISLATVLQRGRGAGGREPVPVILVTHPTEHGRMQKALARLGRLPVMRGAPSVVRIEADDGTGA